MYMGLILSVVCTICISFYFLSVYQYSSYYLNRTFFHFHKTLWHFFYIVLPFIIFTSFLPRFDDYLVAILYAVWHILWVFSWHRKIDKKLVYTKRIKRTYALVVVFALILCGVFWAFYLAYCELAVVVLSIVCGVGVANIWEKFIFKSFYAKAKQKLEKSSCKIILITASYGKTSTKNYLADLLSLKYKVYAPKTSINTLNGIIKDINENLQDCDFYIVEAGAREKNDILDIATLVSPHYSIIGKIGNAHLEYFKSIENTKLAKLKGLCSDRLEGYLLHSSTCFFEEFLNDEKFCELSFKDIKNIDKKYYDDDVSVIKSDLDGIDFKICDEIFSSNLLGEFNATNLAACIKMAVFLGVDKEKIKEKLMSLKAVSHRLERIDSGGKIILDDSFNGNIDGMSASYDICKKYHGRKIIVTPGIVEVDEETNIKLCEKINECFDLAILTSSLNENVFKNHITIEKIFLKDKSNLVNLLATKTSAGDLIIFSNDAPSYV